jgi:ABC-type lipoprotein export system ATPase subunit
MAVLSGPKACGKSTLLRAAAGLGRVAGLCIRISGRELGRLSHRSRRSALREDRLFYLPREPVLISNLTILDNLLLPFLILAERGEAEAAERALGSLEQAGLHWAVGLRPTQLSREHRKMVVLMRGFLRRPRVALMDDPLGSLDIRHRETAREWMRLARDRDGCAILVASRDARRYESLGGNLVVMQPGGGPTEAE